MEKQTVLWGIEQIEEKLPHRFPFVLIDKVLSIESGPDANKRFGRKIRAIKCVTATESHFQGHFPKRRVMPGVLQVEAMAQASALACILPGDEDSFDVAIASIEGARFRKPVVPGDQLLVVAEVVKERGTIFVAKAECFVDGEKVAEAELMAKVFIKNQ